MHTWHQALSTTCEEGRKAEQPPAGKPDGPLPQSSDPASEEGWPLMPFLVALVRQVAEAANALHEAGVVHRDIKPGNIMVDESGTRAVLMDLGLAQLADDVEGRLTRTRQFVGTLRYASPEQVLAVGAVDQRSDVYALGATLWELLTLRPLFDAGEETPTPELMRRIQFEEPQRPRLLNPAVPRDLEAVVLQCLEKDPARRYRTARELSDDLGRWQAGEPVRARRATWGYRLGKFLLRRRKAIAVVAILLFLQMVIVSLFYHFLPHPASLPSKEVEAEARVNGKAAERGMVRRQDGAQATTSAELDVNLRAGPNKVAFLAGSLPEEGGPAMIWVTLHSTQAIPLQTVEVKVNDEKARRLPLQRFSEEEAAAKNREARSDVLQTSFRSGDNTIEVTLDPGEAPVQATVTVHWRFDSAVKGRPSRPLCRRLGVSGKGTRPELCPHRRQGDRAGVSGTAGTVVPEGPRFDADQRGGHARSRPCRTGAAVQGRQAGRPDRGHVCRTWREGPEAGTASFLAISRQRRSARPASSGMTFTPTWASQPLAPPSSCWIRATPGHGSPRRAAGPFRPRTKSVPP